MLVPFSDRGFSEQMSFQHPDWQQDQDRQQDGKKGEPQISGPTGKANGAR